jgi:protein-tyrosine phosphatase
MAYEECDAEDFDGYPLLECHLPAASAFVEAQRKAGGTTLIHCFAGVNRSAALAIAVLMLREKQPLLKVAAAVFEERPFILSNLTFRAQLVQLAAERGLLQTSVSVTVVTSK